MNIYIHPRTKARVDSVVQNTPQVVIISGQHGSGKKNIALEVIKKKEPQYTKKIDSGNFERLIVIDEEKSIGISQIKELESLINLADSNSRYIILNNAEKLTKEAQNAFLKTLEESLKNVYTFFLVQNPESLLPTIRSRAQPLVIFKPSKNEFVTWLSSYNIDHSRANKVYFATGAGSRLAVENLEQTDGQDDIMSAAKELLTAEPNKRIALLKEYEKNSELLTALIETLVTACRGALLNIVDSEAPREKIEFWVSKIELLQALLENLKSHVNQKLIIDKLVINL